MFNACVDNRYESRSFEASTDLQLRHNCSLTCLDIIIRFPYIAAAIPASFQIQSKMKFQVQVQVASDYIAQSLTTVRESGLSPQAVSQSVPQTLWSVTDCVCHSETAPGGWSRVAAAS